ncbi:MAG TPA: asparaginase domain-containing protein [Candidatus Paceibacterota bacterium]|nr:asparaginase domain-containing protein [Candidatus Paceibacterota bacterium]
MKKKKVVILGLGGTISMVPDRRGFLKPAKNVKDILNIVPSLKKMADINFHELENLDSTNINSTHWEKLAWCVAGIHEKVDGIIVIHGTDTMAYTAGALALILGRKLKIPIVFTGSQLSLTAHGTDAKFNLENALKIILQANIEGIAEVMIVSSYRVLRASRAVKVSDAQFAAFDSPTFPWIAQIDGAGIKFSSNAFKKSSSSILEINPKFERGILTVDLVPGLEPEILLEILRSGKCKGLLLKSLGSKNVPSVGEYSLLPVIREAVNVLNIPVLISSKFAGRHTSMDPYEPGKMAIDAGAISTKDMTEVMAQVKFMWALAQKPKNFEDLKKIINTDFVGEITV